MGLSNHIVEMLTADAKRKRRPITVNFELLPVCNLDCKMCYIRTEMKTVQEKGGLIPAEKWLNIARELKQSGVLFLLLTGGEVFLYPDFRYLYEEVVKMGFIVTINTNGTMIDEEVVSWLKKMPPKCVSLSLYGASNETYEALCGRKNMFDKINHAIELMQEAGITIECKTMLNPLNIHDMEACYEYCRKRNILYEMATYAFPPARKTGEIEQVRFTAEEAVKYQFDVNHMISSQEANEKSIAEHLQRYLRNKGNPGCQQYGFNCSAANSSCWITWEGHMTACAMLNDPYVDPFELGFENAWEKLKEEVDKIKLCTACSFCDKRSVCTVCPASACAETGRIDGCSSYHCEMTERKLKAMFQYVEEHNLCLEENTK